MKLLVYGSHTGEWDAAVGRELDFFLKVDRSLFLVLPFEAGVCRAAYRWAQNNAVPCQKFIADVFEFDKAAGYERNKEIIRSGIDAAMLFDGGYFHKHFLELCAHVPIYRKNLKETVALRHTKKRILK